VIEGFRIDMTAAEILEHLEARIERHRDRAARCDAKRIRLEGANEPNAPDDDDDEDQQLAMCWPGYIEELERRVERHRRHEAALVFLRDHVVAHEKSIGLASQTCDSSNWACPIALEQRRESPAMNSRL